MCFPSKKQKNNFSDNADKSSKPKEPKTEVPLEPTKAEPAPAATEPTPAAPSTAPELPPVAVAFCTEKCVQRVGRDVCHSHPGSFISRVEHALTACFFERRLVHSASEPFLQGFGLKSE